MINQTSVGEATAVPVGRMRWSHCVVLGAVCVLVIAFYAWIARSGLSELCGSGAADSYYNLLVQGFQIGQLNLKIEVPPGLAHLADPYDPDANLPYRLLGDVEERRRDPGLSDSSAYLNSRLLGGYRLGDMSYYNGKLYLYFGVTPTLLLFWPYAALTGHYLLHKDAVVIFCAVGFLTSTGLLWAVWRCYFGQMSFGVVVAGALALGLASGLPVILPRSDVYEVPIVCGYALVMLALAALWRALQGVERTGWWLLAASTAYGLAVGARPSLLFGAVILLVPVAQSWRERRQVWVLLLAATGPMVMIGLGLMVYNALRFNSPFDFGWGYQLGGFRQGQVQPFSLHYLWFNFRVYFLEAARWNGRFPFVQDIVLPRLPAGHYGVDAHVFGVLTNVPVVWLALAAPLAWRGLCAEACPTMRWFLMAVVLLFGVSALTLGPFFAAQARYELEFVPELVLLAMIGILGLERALGSRPGWRRAARWGWGLLLAWSVAFNLTVSVEARAASYNDLGYVLQGKGHVEEAITYYKRALELQPDNAIAHNNIANVLSQKGQVDEAITHYQRALEIQPDYAKAHNNLGGILLQKGQVDQAMAHFQKVLEIQPDDATAHENLGVACLHKGRVEDAMAQFQKALEIQPDCVEAHLNFGSALLQRGRAEEGISHYNRALELQPDNAIARNNVANVLVQQGRKEEAVVQFMKALEIEPRNAVVEKNLAWVLATSAETSVRNGARAIDLAQEANQLSGGNEPEIIGTLAAAYAEAGRFTEAIATVQQAIQLATFQTNAALVNDLRAHLKLYQGGSPVRDTAQTATPASASQPGSAH